MAQASDYKQVINTKSHFAANMDGESSHEKVMESDSLLLCDYIRLRKVRTSKQKAKATKADKKLKVLATNAYLAKRYL